MVRPGSAINCISRAARAVVGFGFCLREIVSFTTLGNLASRAVTGRLEMTELATYDHPVPGGPSLASVCYLLTAPAPAEAVGEGRTLGAS